MNARGDPLKLKALLSGIDYVVLQNSEQMEQADIGRIPGVPGKAICLYVSAEPGQTVMNLSGMYMRKRSGFFLLKKKW